MVYFGGGVGVESRPWGRQFVLGGTASSGNNLLRIEPCRRDAANPPCVAVALRPLFDLWLGVRFWRQIQGRARFFNIARLCRPFLPERFSAPAWIVHTG